MRLGGFRGRSARGNIDRNLIYRGSNPGGRDMSPY